MVFKRPLGLCCFAIFLSVCLRDSQVHTQLTGIQEKQRPDERRFLDRTDVISSSEYAWSAWGSWSPCSRTCGGGVAVQERKCLPRDPSRFPPSRKRRKMTSNRIFKNSVVRRVRSTVYTKEPDCPGLARRYHECNTAPCPGLSRDPRAEQCAVYDRRPFRGRFYTWVPYVDGNSPCTLNCRPRGQQFYASLALVADGTPCTKPGFRAICVQGNCLAVGREGVLASSAVRDVRCGSRLVSGLFSRQKLPLGYSYVATVPRGSCRLNVSEIKASDNYIALKLTNGSYIINGEFAVSAPGTYDAAGARFMYSRDKNFDMIFAAGPIHQPVDIMVLYTNGNSNLKYEYLTDTDNNEIQPFDKNLKNIPQHHEAPRHHRRHNAEHTKALDGPSTDNHLESQSIESNVIGNRKFAWKILSFTQCSRSCGGGLQVGKFKCVDESKGKEVSPAHCQGTPPPSRRRRCGGAPCPPRWRAANWSECPVCGPAHRTRIVGCVQDHAHGITKISDQKCREHSMPPNREPCDIPDCDASLVTPVSPRLDAKRQVRPIDRTDNFRDGPVISLVSNTTENELSPTLSPSSYSFSAGGGWMYTEWSECVGWCVGGGVQSRGVRCADPSGCSPHQAPASTQPCKITKQCEAQWFTGDWSPCSATCGGRQVRGVICIGSNSRRFRDTFCREQKPASDRACGGHCSPSWYLSDWGECQGPCEAGVQSRTVWCALGGEAGAAGAARDNECPGTRPLARKSCVPSRCSTRPIVKPTAFANPPAAVSESQPRVQRHQSGKTQIARDRPVPTGNCVDKLSHCALAVQARLCHYPYYTDYCCKSCYGR